MNDPRQVRRGLRIGLTGGIACGKSEVGRILQNMGIAVLDADDVSHELIRAGHPLFERVLSVFGRDILGADGEVDRRILGERVFADARKMKELESIIHPAVVERIRTWLAGESAAGQNAAVIVPLLHEVGLIDPWDAVICVAAPDEMAVERLRGRGFSEGQAWARVKAQMPIGEKVGRSDYVIWNTETLAALKKNTETVIQDLKEKRGCYG